MLDLSMHLAISHWGSVFSAHHTVAMPCTALYATVRSEMSQQPGVARDNGLSSLDHHRAIYAYVCFVSTYLFHLTQFTFMMCFAT